jgi:hypothetical protein
MLSGCKRDALPTELTARAPEMAAFRPILKLRFDSPVERSGNGRTSPASNVPNYSRSALLGCSNHHPKSDGEMG